MGSLGLLRRVALGACGASRQEVFALSRLFSDAPGFGAEPEAATGFAPRERRPPGFKVFIGNMAWRTDNQGARRTAPSPRTPAPGRRPGGAQDSLRPSAACRRPATLAQACGRR